ncbi:MAG: hypothetical protein V8S72_01100 [Oscillospiraceae bacterium]
MAALPCASRPTRRSDTARRCSTLSGSARASPTPLTASRSSEINYETFNAASAKWEVNGFNIHPGSAKNMMIKASLGVREINSMLPSGDPPLYSEGYEGFFHLTDISCTVEKAMPSYIIRDHIAASSSTSA